MKLTSRIFIFMLCFLMVLFPMAAMAVGDGPDAGEGISIPIEDIINESTGVWQSLAIITAAILADTLLGILVSLKLKVFEVSKLPQFLLTGVMPYIGGLLILAILAYSIGVPFVGLFFAAAVFIAGKYISDIVDKFGQLFN